jgi:processing peptidase subunit beta
LVYPETEVTSLDNGLRVATEDTGSKSATIALYIDAGSRFETEETNGIANFFEHMAFKGTAKRSQADLEKEVESLGAQLKAVTGREQTAIYAKCMSKDVPKIVDILGDIVTNTKFNEEEVSKVRKNVLRSLDEAEAQLREVTLDYLHSIAYQGTPLGKSVLGPTNNIKKFKGADIAAYLDNHFKAPRMVLAAAGGIDHKELSGLAKQHLGSVSNKYPGEIPSILPCRYTGSEIRVRNDDMPFVHVAIAVEGVGASDKDCLALSLATALLGSWDRTHGGGKIVANRLAAQSHEYGLCHSFEAFNINYRDTGLWGIYFVGEHKIQDDMVYAIQQEWMRMCTNLGDFEVERGKNILRTALLGRLDSTCTTADDIGRQILLLGKRLSPSEVNSRIQALSAEDVKEACMKYIYDRCPVVAGVGPTENLPDYNVVRSGMYWLRL